MQRFKTTKASYWYFGKLYGYPKCCIKAFCHHTITKRLRFEDFSEEIKMAAFGGFVPCERHAQLLNRDIVRYHDIIARTTFPNTKVN